MGSSKAKRSRTGLAVVSAQERSAAQSEPRGALGANSEPFTTTVASAGGPGETRPPDPEVPEKAGRRRFTAEYKLRILQEADHCRDTNGIGSLLRREGLYSSHLSKWRQQRQEGSLSALAPRKRGRPADKPHPDTKRLAQVEREKRHLERRLRQAEALLELQKKVSEILGIDLPPVPTDENE